MSEPLADRIALAADDDEYFRMALCAVLRQLGFISVIETGSFDEAVERLEAQGEIGLAIFDLSMPGIDGPQALRTIRESFPVRKLAVVSASTSRSDILRSLEAGAHGFVSKGQGVKELQSALRQIIQGALYVPPALADLGQGNVPRLAEARAPRPERPAVHLTARQRDVLEMLVQGKANKEIARSLSLGPGTVKVHLAALFRTLGVANRAAAAVAGADLLRRLDRAVTGQEAASCTARASKGTA